MYVNDDLVKRYMKSLTTEFHLKIQQDDIFSTVYIGGGTPSVLPKENVQTLFKLIQSHVHADTEITFEMNPEDVTDQYLKMLIECGVNRISLGVQSFSDELIQRVGRNHTSGKSLEAIKIIQAHAINVTIDLMFALPGQTMLDVKNDLRIIKELNLPHISLYSLILEKRTRLYIQQSKYQFIDEDTEAEMYEYIIETLGQFGYQQYEISNFAKSSVFKSKHNLAYWHQQHYYGLGLGAHQFIENVRSSNTKSINAYIRLLEDAKLPLHEEEVLTEKQLFEEFCFLAFRDCEDGLNILLLKSKYPKVYNEVRLKISQILSDLKQDDLIEMFAEERYRLTEKGKLLANNVFQAFIEI